MPNRILKEKIFFGVTNIFYKVTYNQNIETSEQNLLRAQNIFHIDWGTKENVRSNEFIWCISRLENISSFYFECYFLFDGYSTLENVECISTPSLYYESRTIRIKLEWHTKLAKDIKYDIWHQTYKSLSFDTVLFSSSATSSSDSLQSMIQQH